MNRGTHFIGNLEEKILGSFHVKVLVIYIAEKNFALINDGCKNS